MSQMMREVKAIMIKREGAYVPKLWTVLAIVPFIVSAYVCWTH